MTVNAILTRTQKYKSTYFIYEGILLLIAPRRTMWVLFFACGWDGTRLSMDE